MPVTFGAKPPAATPAPASSQAQHNPAPTPAASAYQGPRVIANAARESEGFGAPPPGESGGSGSGKGYEYFRDNPLPAGSYTFIACVGDICRLVTKTGHASTLVEWKVLSGDEAGRPIGWNQSPAPNASDKARAFWQRTFIAAYAAGGWTWDPDQTTGWPGWAELDRKDANGNPVKVAPMDLFFVEQCADGVVVPICLEIRVVVDQGYEQYPKTVSVKRYLDTNGRPVQAPMPRRVPQWLAQQHGWIGEAIVLGGAPHSKLHWKQIPLGHAGLSTYKGLQ